MYYAYSVQEVLLISVLSAIMIDFYIKTNVFKFVPLNYTSPISQIVHVPLAISLVCNALALITIIALNVPTGNTLIWDSV